MYLINKINCREVKGVESHERHGRIQIIYSHIIINGLWFLAACK
jgi:hypothetical protein